MSEKALRGRLGIFGLLLLLVLLLYITRPDDLSAVHWWPMAFWTPVVFLPFLTFRFRGLLRCFLIGLGLWAVALHTIREPSGLVFWPVGAKPENVLRIVSLNCAAGTVDAAREAFGVGAEIVLLQEVGDRKGLVEAGRKAGYPYVSWAIDDAVFSRRPLRNLVAERDYAAATVDLGGRPVRLVALRLLPPVFRLDLWNPDCWGTYATDAVRRRERLREIFPDGACLVGGDFNATNPRLVTDTRPELTEAGRAAGRGWRGTGTNDYPFVAVDQLWASPEFEWRQAFAQKTTNSDHRMLVADFIVLPRGRD